MSATTKEQSSETATVSKMAAVKTALKELGKKAQPLDIQSFVKKQYNLEMSTAHISNYKSMILNPKGGRKRRGRPPASENAAGDVAIAIRVPSRRSSESGITINDIETVKSLVSRVGADSLKTLVDLLNR